MARLSLLRRKAISSLLAIGRWRFLRPAVSLFFKHMPHRLPVERLLENEHWLACHHPQPTYPLHILILPKQGIATLSDILEGQPDFYTSLFVVVKDMIYKFDLDTRGYRLITNGGPNQSIPQWHWHLISEGSEENNA